MQKYHACVGPGGAEFVTLINTNLSKGWTLYGSIVNTPDGNLYQAMLEEIATKVPAAEKVKP